MTEQPVSEDHSHLHAAVVGCGSIGRRHIENLLELDVGTVDGVDLDSERKNRIKQEFGIWTGEFDSALDRDPDVVVICTPSNTHVPIAQEAVDSKCHIFVEKPLSDTMSGVDDLVRSAASHGLVSLVGCNMRFHPAVQTANDLISSGEIGDVLSVRIEAGSYLPNWHPDEDYRDSYSARADLGGGAILDYIHEIDYARWLFGDISAVTAMIDQTDQLEIDVEDLVEILLRFDNGAIGEVHVDYVQRSYSRSYHIVGSDGTLRWNWNDGVVRWYSARDDGEIWRKVPLPDDWAVNDMYLDEMEHLLACVQGAETSICPLSEGRESLRVALAAKESADRGEHIAVQSGSSYNTREDE